MNEIRVNAEGTAVAIRRTDQVGDDHALAWGIMTVDNGGHLAAASEVEAWAVLPAPTKAALKAAAEKESEPVTP